MSPIYRKKNRQAALSNRVPLPRDINRQQGDGEARKMLAEKMARRVREKDGRLPPAEQADSDDPQGPTD